MSILLDKMSTTVEIGGVEYEIITDFRTWIEFETLMQSDLESRDKILEALQLVFPVLPDNINGAVDRLLWFYRCGKEPAEYKSKKQDDIYSYEQDDGYIYSAFLEQYGIDIQAVEYMHWWKFKNLFTSLGTETQIVKIMGYRSIDISSKMSKEQREFYKEMKRVYALPKSQTEKEKMSDIDKVLMGDGDLRGVI